MIFSQSEKDQFIPKFVRWAENQSLVRAAILTSTLAVPGAAVDIFSDFDMILILSDVRPFFEDRAWLEDFGPRAGYVPRPAGTQGWVSQVWQCHPVRELA